MNQQVTRRSSASSRRRSSGSLVTTVALWRLVEVEIPNVKHTGLQKADQTHLPRAIAPDLADHSSRHVNGHAMFRCELDQATHTPIITLERDQRTSVEDYRPRA